MYGPCPNTLGRMLSCFFLTPAGSDIQDIPWLLEATPSPSLSAVMWLSPCVSVITGKDLYHISPLWIPVALDWASP